MTRARTGLLPLLVLTAVAGSACASSASGVAPGPVDRVVLMVRAGVSLEGVLAVPEFVDLSRAGGVALMTTHDTLPPLGTALAEAGIEVCAAEGSVPPAGWFGSALPACPGGATPGRRLIVATPDTSGAGTAVRDAVATANGGSTAPVAVLVVAPEPSAGMIRSGDQVPPLIEAVGSPQELFDSGGELGTLTSDTTRRDGVVANVDVGPTVFDLFGTPVPPSMTGSPIRIVDGPPPLALHARYLEYRRIRGPVNPGLITFVSVMFVLSAGVIAWTWAGRRLARWVGGSMQFLVLCAIGFPVALGLSGAVLQTFRPLPVASFLLLFTLALALVAWLPRRGMEPMRPFSAIAVAGLAVIVVDVALFQGTSLSLSLLGGTLFDGVRFYGLPNAYSAVVLASSVFVAAWLRPVPGLLFLAGVALFVGAPGLGADLGGAVTLLAAAGLWWGLRTRPRFGWIEAVVALGTVVVGTVVVLAMNRFLPGPPSHIGRFVEGTGLGPGGVVHRFWDRLQVGLRQVADVPWVLIPLLGLVVLLWIAVANAGPVCRALQRVGEGWRDALIALTVGGIVSFVANDTGVAAAAPVFLYAMALATYPLLVRPDVREPSVPGSVPA